jgi:DNA-binding CsgD family transcriptional regulator
MLVGRSAETAVIDRLLAAALEGRSGVLVVRGDAGVGKSALLERAVERADGFTVLRGVGVEVESELAYAALHQILRPVFDRIERLPEPQAAALRAAFALSDETVDQRFRVSLGVLGLLAEVAEERPLLCVVDDAQWLDQASADALVFTARRLDAEPLALLFAARDDPERSFHAPGLAELRPSRLSPSDARTLVAERFGADVAPEAVDWVLENANGNPLALVELPGALTPAQVLGREPLVSSIPPTTSVEAAYLQRVDRLPPPTRQLLLLAACEETGDRSTITRAGAELGLDSEALVVAEERGLVRVGHDRVEFRHPLVRSAVYRGAGFAERERAHRALAAVLSRPADADRRAWHRSAATVGTDEEVADELERTAERARLRSGYAATAAAMERAAELTADTDSRARRLVSAVSAAWHAGQPSRASALADRASPFVSNPRQRAELDHVRGEIQHRSGALLAAGRILMAGAEVAAPVDSRKALEMLFDAASSGMQSGDYALVAKAGQRAAALARSNDDEERFLADLLVGVGSLWLGTTAQEVPLVLDVIARAEAFDEPRWLTGAAMGASTLGHEASEALLLSRAVALARASGAVDSLTLALLSTAVAGILGGRFAVAAEASEGLRLAREAQLPGAASLQLAILAWFAAARGEDDECRSFAAEVVESAAATGNALANSIAEWGLALLDLGRGRPEETITRLGALAAAPIGVGHPLIVLMSAPDLVEACVRTGREEQARAAGVVLERFAQPGAPTWALALAARCHAVRLQGAAAETAFYDALRLHAESNRPFDRARTELLYGEFLRRERRRTDAREQLRAALDAFERLRTEPWAERARAELRASGEMARKRDPSTLADLTPQELQIARLVGEGSSNKDVAAQLFLSPRTVEYHLRKVFMKLGISSRGELIRHGVGHDADATVALT